MFRPRVKNCAQDTVAPNLSRRDVGLSSEICPRTRRAVPDPDGVRSEYYQNENRKVRERSLRSINSTW